LVNRQPSVIKKWEGLVEKLGHQQTREIGNVQTFCGHVRGFGCPKELNVVGTGEKWVTSSSPSLYINHNNILTRAPPQSKCSRNFSQSKAVNTFGRKLIIHAEIPTLRARLTFL